jgi:hypothetical protein
MGDDLYEFLVLPRSVAGSGYSAASASTPGAKRGVKNFIVEIGCVCWCCGKASVREGFSLFPVVPGGVQYLLKSLAFSYDRLGWSWYCISYD